MLKSARWFIALVMLAVVITGIVIYYPVWTLDIFISQIIQRLVPTDIGLPVMHFITNFEYLPANILILITTISPLLKIRQYRTASLVLVSLMTAPLNSILKSVIARPRPTTDFIQIFEHNTGYSFPSQHVMVYTVFFGFLIYVYYSQKVLPVWIRWPIVIFCGIAISLIGISRMYLGAHWFTDVIGGYLWGAVILWLFILFSQQIRDKKESPNNRRPERTD